MANLIATRLLGGGKSKGKGKGKGHGKGSGEKGGKGGKGSAETAAAASPSPSTPICTNCGKPGHRAVDCWSPDLADTVCHCCGWKGHRQAECPKNHLECRTCHETGHLAKTCPKTLNCKSSKPDVEKEESSGRKPLWKCVERKEVQYHDRDNCYVKNCKAKRRFLGEEGDITTKPKKEKECFTMKAVGEEVVARIQGQAGEQDEEQHPLPEAEVQAQAKYDKLTKLIDTLTEAGETEWAEEKTKERARLKMPVPDRPLQDKADLTGRLAEFESKYEKESTKLVEARKKCSRHRSTT